MLGPKYLDIGLAFLMDLSVSAPDIKVLLGQAVEILWEGGCKFCWWPTFSKACFVGLTIFVVNSWPLFSLEVLFSDLERTGEQCLLTCWQSIWGMLIKWHRPPNVHCEDDTTWSRRTIFMWTTDEKCSRVGTDQFSLVFEALFWISWDKNHIQQVASFIWV